ncbi:knotted1 [Dorcoceras hygrometricum]|uniref:Knotted1 n=1 Tax=Dorcoceras hygrometricum TaxID=472368 RepID=A0A2Z7BWA4_9LAMI|nr:knotted1 [Dorcoceras hygrometricum]
MLTWISDVGVLARYSAGRGANPVGGAPGGGVLSFYQLAAIASSLFTNTLRVCFDSVLAMDNPGMVSMFEALMASGLSGFLGCPAVLYEDALTEFFLNGSVRDGRAIAVVQPVSVFGFQRPMVTSWGWSQLCTEFFRYSLFSGLLTVDFSISGSATILIRPSLGSANIFDTGVQLPHISFSPASVSAPDVQSITSSDSSADSSLHFNTNDISMEDDAALDQSILPSSAADISASFAALRESFSKLVANQTSDSRKSGDAHSEVLSKITHVERVFLDSLAVQNEAFRVCLKVIARKLKMITKVVRTQNAILSKDLAATQKEVKDLKVALSKEFDDKLADICNDLLEFHVETQEQLASLGAHLAELIAFITKGSDDKKGEGSSNRPQLPPDDQNRPSGGSGSRADDPSRYGGGTIIREGANRRGDISGSSKRRRTDSGGGSGGHINYGPYLPSKRDAEYWISGKRQF